MYILLKLEEYIKKRKKEDGINEFEMAKRLENARICSNYVFEYFEKYLDEHKDENTSIPENRKMIKYRKQLEGYDSVIVDWLVKLYGEYGNYVNKTLGNIIDKDDLFLLYTEESEFRSLSYSCYSDAVKKHRYLRNESEMIFQFVKSYQKYVNNRYSNFVGIEKFPEKIQVWIESTYDKYAVNIVAFAYEYINYFFDTPSIWPPKQRHKSKEPFVEYEYDYKSGKDLFNIDGVYTRISNKPFIKRHKKDLELILMYFWLHDIYGDTEYWQTYLGNREERK